MASRGEFSDVTPWPCHRAAPRLIDFVLGDETHAKVTRIRKGVCFDTCGLDLKNSSAWPTIKKDMGGAACVLASRG